MELFTPAAARKARLLPEDTVGSDGRIGWRPARSTPKVGRIDHNPLVRRSPYFSTHTHIRLEDPPVLELGTVLVQGGSMFPASQVREVRRYYITLPPTIMEVDNGLLEHYCPLQTWNCPLPCLFQGVQYIYDWVFYFNTYFVEF